MTVETVRRERNQSMECCKMLAAMLVVLIHIEFPGKLNAVAEGLTEFAVPMFFTISGFFNYRADCPTISRRLRHILGLFVQAYVIHLSVMFLVNLCMGRSLMDFFYAALPDLEEVPKLWIAQQPQLLAQLWTVLSTALAYCVLWCYTRFAGEKNTDYRWLYAIGGMLFCAYFLMASVLPGVGAEIPYHAFRNGWFMGIPYFLTGMFLHQHYERICTGFRLTTGKLTALVILGETMILGNYLLSWAGVSFGVLIQVPALMLLLIGHPQIVQKESHKLLYTMVSKFGILSTAVYLLHITVKMIYVEILQDGMIMKLGGLEPWLRPLMVLALSILAAILYERINHLWKHIKRKKA